MFTLTWTCDQCGHKIQSVEQPEEYDCVCFIESKEEESLIPNPPHTVKTFVGGEREDRYRKQYELNGYKWDGQPFMFTGAFANYPAMVYYDQ